MCWHMGETSRVFYKPNVRLCPGLLLFLFLLLFFLLLFLFLPFPFLPLPPLLFLLPEVTTGKVT